MTLTPLQYIQSLLHDVVEFFSQVFSLFPPVIISFLFFVPALWLVFEVVRYFRDSFKG